MVAKVTVLSEANFEISLRQAGKPVVVSFGATWSSPARAVTRQLNDLAAMVGDSVRIASLDTDENPSLPRILRIKSLPTLSVFIGGVEKARTSQPMTTQEMAAWVSAETSDVTSGVDSDDGFFL